MFTGIVTAVGRIAQTQPHESHDDSAGIRVRIDCGNLGLSDVQLGDSIAVQGACMTVVALEGNSFDIRHSSARACALPSAWIAKERK